MTSSSCSGYWDKLSDGGNVTMPLEKQMWGDVFGMCTDRYGVPWMVDIVTATELINSRALRTAIAM